MQSLCVRLPKSKLKGLLIPEPTMTRTITSTLQGEFIDLVYWLDTYLVSDKQIKWIANIKTKIKMLIPEVEFISFNKSFNYITESGMSFSLKQLSDLWSIAAKEKTDIVAKRVKLPSLYHIDNTKKDKYILRDLYRPMMIHCKNLYYYHSFSYESVAAGFNEALKIIGVTMQPKAKRKFCESIYSNFSKHLLSNPHKYKQKLLGKDKITERTNRTDRLVSKKKEIKEDNIAKVLEVISNNPLCIKPNGTYNSSAIARATKLSRKTVHTILKGINNTTI